MFYPSDSLKRGGRFYLCWVADSWPLRFATITHRQLWSQDVRKICDDLLEVINNESGRPTNRFSLRLSSQLMRGLVRLYQRKVSVILSELCMINAHVFKHTNKKQERRARRSSPHTSPNGECPQLRTLPLVDPQVVIQEEPENEQRVEEMIQNSGNVVMNIQDITLREETIPEFRLPPNDGFGEENPNQALNLLVDRTMEMMMVPTDASAAQHSGLDLPGLDLTEKSHDKSRLVPQDVQMERISEHEVSMFRRSEGLLPTADFEKEIPEISEIPIPELPQPQEKTQEVEAPEVLPQIPEVVSEIPEVRPEIVETVAPAQRPEEIVLEELEEIERQPKRRRARKLIIDKTTKLSSNILRARIDNINVDLRCEDSSDDIIELRVPSDVLLRRPCCSGAGFDSKTASEITRMFMRNLGFFHKATSCEREIEEAAIQRALAHTTVLHRIEEVDEPQLPQMPQARAHEMETSIQNITANNVIINISPRVFPGQEVNLSKDKQPEPEDIADLPTQKIDTLSQQQRKRSSVSETTSSPKRARSIGYVSFRDSQREKQKQQAMEQTVMEFEVQPPQEPPVIIEEPIPPPKETCEDIDKENIPQNYQKPREKDAEKSLTALLQQAGLADMQTNLPLPQETAVNAEINGQSQRKTSGGEHSETPLGSLDRTKVSLGDSDDTTDSRRFIRDQWGTEGTMIKILRMIKAATVPVTVGNLIAKGPVLSGYRKIIIARCFYSILKLKQHGFIIIKKNPKTLGIEDIRLGRKFD